MKKTICVFLAAFLLICGIMMPNSAINAVAEAAEPTKPAPTEAPTPVPTVPGPTEAPDPEPTTPAPTEAPTPVPTVPGPTEAPDPEPTTPDPTEAPDPEPPKPNPDPEPPKPTDPTVPDNTETADPTVPTVPEETSDPGPAEPETEPPYVEDTPKPRPRPRPAKPTEPEETEPTEVTVVTEATEETTVPTEETLPEETVVEDKTAVAADADGKIVLKPEAGESQKTTMSFSEETLTQIKDMAAKNPSEGLIFQVGETQVSYDSKAMEVILAAVEDAKSLEITVEKRTGTDQNLTPAQFETLSQNSKGAVYAIELVVTREDGQETLSDFAGGTAAVTVPYTGKMTSNVKVYRVEEDGSLTRVDSQVNGKDGTLTFYTGSHSYYLLKESVKVSMILIPVLVILAAAGAAAAFVIIRKRR